MLTKILNQLKSLGNPKDVEGMARFGINTNKTFGIKVPVLRKMAKEIGINHKLALELWDSGYHEARLLAGMIADIKETDAKMMDKWVKDFDSWDICDGAMLNIFWKSPIAWDKAVEWSERKPEFERRAGFALMACLAFKSKKSDDSEFDRFIPCIIKATTDERNFVRKAVNWALRQIGKRNKFVIPSEARSET
jgi:3-methyladenine DNA glycosylase AlkD